MDDTTPSDRIGARIMFKMSLAVFRKPTLTRTEFSQYWRGVHAPLVLSLASDIRLLRYVQLHGEDGEMSRRFTAHRGLAAIHDGVAELWWESEAERLEAAASQRGIDAAQRLRDDELQFCDLARSTVCFGAEVVVLGTNLPPV